MDARTWWLNYLTRRGYGYAASVYKQHWATLDTEAQYRKLRG